MLNSEFKSYSEYHAEGTYIVRRFKVKNNIKPLRCAPELPEQFHRIRIDDMRHPINREK
jgi:hypothetical protein